MILKAKRQRADVLTEELESLCYKFKALFHLEATVCHSVGEFVRGMAHTNGIESVWAVLKRGYNGVYHKMSFKRLDRYLNEFTFRLKEE